MTFMLCRSRVKDYKIWKAVFDSHEQAHRDAGLKLANIWRSIEEPNNVFFSFEVTNIDIAREFINNPDSADVGKAAGVVDGEYHFVETTEGY